MNETLVKLGKDLLKVLLGALVGVLGLEASAASLPVLNF